MRFYYKITPELDAVSRGLARSVRGARRAGMIGVVTAVESIARRNAPVKTSNLANSGTSDVNESGSRGEVRFTAPYARFVHEGTGLYGPHRTKIVPKSAKALFWPGAAHPVRAVKGMQGVPFLSDAADEADIARFYRDGVEGYLAKQGAIR